MKTITKEQLSQVKDALATRKTIGYSDNRLFDFMKDITIVMQEDDAKEWLAALRSGKYKKGTGALYNPKNKSLCCLGVQQHVQMDGLVESIEVGNHRSFINEPTREYLNHYGIIYLSSYGHQTTSPYIPSMLDNVVDLNDESFGNHRHKYNFNQIADMLEKHMAVYK